MYIVYFNCNYCIFQIYLKNYCTKKYLMLVFNALMFVLLLKATISIKMMI